MLRATTMTMTIPKTTQKLCTTGLDMIMTNFYVLILINVWPQQVAILPIEIEIVHIHIHIRRSLKIKV